MRKAEDGAQFCPVCCSAHLLPQTGAAPGSAGLGKSRASAFGSPGDHEEHQRLTRWSAKPSATGWTTQRPATSAAHEHWTWPPSADSPGPDGHSAARRDSHRTKLAECIPLRRDSSLPMGAIQASPFVCASPCPSQRVVFICPSSPHDLPPTTRCNVLCMSPSALHRVGSARGTRWSCCPS